MGYWVALKRVGAKADDLWKVDGAGSRLGFFFEGTSDAMLATFVDPSKWRFVFVNGHPMIGVTLHWDGVRALKV